MTPLAHVTRDLFPRGKRGWEPLPHQVPPLGNWRVWVIRGGRGAGKTDGAAAYLNAWMMFHPEHRGAIIAPTLGDAVEACVNGPSGLKAHNPEVHLHQGPGGMHVRWDNGAEAKLFGAYSREDVERLRAGGNRHIAWAAELAAWRYLGECWDHLEFGLRLGSRPHIVADTTPKPRKRLQQILAHPLTVETHGTTDDNPHLDVGTRRHLHERYDGTRLGAQELLGRMLTTVEGALLSEEKIRQAHLPDRQFLTKVVVALDPADGVEEGDEQATVVAGLGLDHRAYVLHVEGVRVTPTEWINRAFDLADRWQANAVVYERNYGGAFLETTLRTVLAARVRRGLGHHMLHEVSAKHGKRTRAEPVADLHEQGRVLYCVDDEDLIEQWTTWVPDSGMSSPDRLDACVYSIVALGMVGGVTSVQRVDAPVDYGFAGDLLAQPW